jgi:glycosyltransferase involved in cell wall biosynthesis
MKILQVGPKSVHVSSFIETLKSRNQELFLLSEELTDFDGIKENFVVSFRSLNPITFISNLFKIRKIIKECRPDVIHIHQINRLAFFVASIAQNLNIRVITTAWGSDVLLIPKKNFLFHYLVKKTLQNSNIVTADSNEMIGAMKEIYEFGNYKLLQYGIEPIEPTPKENIVYSNRLHEPLYRINQIIDYFADFIQVHPDWQLIIAGTGSETLNLNKKVNYLGLESQIRFVGWQQKKENRSYYAKAKIYISIPESDGTSVSLLEAMSAGCIPVVSDLPVSYEWIENGKNGILETPNQNPLLEAVNLDPDVFKHINFDLIQNRASRDACLTRFLQYYSGIEKETYEP